MSGLADGASPSGFRSSCRRSLHRSTRARDWQHNRARSKASAFLAMASALLSPSRVGKIIAAVLLPALRPAACAGSANAVRCPAQSASHWGGRGAMNAPRMLALASGKTHSTRPVSRLAPVRREGLTGGPGRPAREGECAGPAGIWTQARIPEPACRRLRASRTPGFIYPRGSKALRIPRPPSGDGPNAAPRRPSPGICEGRRPLQTLPIPGATVMMETWVYAP